MRCSALPQQPLAKQAPDGSRVAPALTRMSSKVPFWSTARQSQCLTPAIVIGVGKGWTSDRPIGSIGELRDEDLVPVGTVGPDDSLIGDSSPIGREIGAKG